MVGVTYLLGKTIGVEVTGLPFKQFVRSQDVFTVAVASEYPRICIKLMKLSYVSPPGDREAEAVPRICERFSGVTKAS